MNDFAFVLDKIKKAEEVKNALESWLYHLMCKHYFMDEVYEEYCENPKSKPNQKKNQKHGYDFEPKRDCPKCKYYARGK
jgi:hypothetical protein